LYPGWVPMEEDEAEGTSSSSKVKPSQVKPSQVKASQVKSSQVKVWDLLEEDEAGGDESDRDGAILDGQREGRLVPATSSGWGPMGTRWAARRSSRTCHVIRVGSHGYSMGNARVVSYLPRHQGGVPWVLDGQREGRLVPATSSGWGPMGTRWAARGSSRTCHVSSGFEGWRVEGGGWRKEG
jgi:hypothetical protein